MMCHSYTTPKAISGTVLRKVHVWVIRSTVTKVKYGITQSYNSAF